jgi:hypothetical protein
MSSTGGGPEPTVHIPRINWINFWIYSGLVLGALASVSANIAYTYIPPPHQPAWWPRSRLWDPAAYLPPPGDVAVAVFCPVAIFILTEVITRPRWRDGKLSFGIRVASTALVGLPVAVASYLHLCSLLEYYSSIPFIAYSLPLTVDGLMLACTAALQMTGPEPSQTHADADASQCAPATVEAVMPRPRLSLDNAVPAAHGSPPGRDGVQHTQPPVSVPKPSNTYAPTPVGSAQAGGSGAADLGKRPYPLPTPPVDTDMKRRSPGDRSGGSGLDHSPLAVPPVGLVRPPAGTVLLPLRVLLPPRSAIGPGAAPSADSGLTGGGPSGTAGDAPGLPVPPGRLGSSDLTDAEIIAVAIADKPEGLISATALVKAFGIGSGRATRLRNEIAEIRDEVGRRSLATQLAAGLREVIERQCTANSPGATEPSETAEERSTSPDSADMDDTIKASPEVSRQGP